VKQEEGRNQKSESKSQSQSSGDQPKAKKKRKFYDNVPKAKSNKRKKK
jgi:ribonuclease R